MKNCENCKYALLEDYGPSNYTVEGTMFHCLKRLHPRREGVDRWYGGEPSLKFAEECPGFTPGDAIFVDVEQDETHYGSGKGKPWWEAYIDDDERRELAAAFELERATGIDVAS